MKNGRFSKRTVVFCIAEMTLIQIWAMLIASFFKIEVTGILTANHTVFGGELLLLCLKRIFVKEDKENNMEVENNDENLG